MDYAHRQRAKATPSCSKRATRTAPTRCWLTRWPSDRHWPTKNKDGTLLSRTNVEEAVPERSVRHADIILCRASEFSFSAPTASRLVACPVCCGLGLFHELGRKMAQTLAGGTGRRGAGRTDCARPLASP